MPNAHDVIVVGAGITGLAAATRFAAAGLDVLVLEARDRVGGRLLSVSSKDGHHGVDLGASWFWGDEARVYELAHNLGLATHAQHTAGDALFQTGEGVQRLEGNPLDAPALRFQDGAQSLPLALATSLSSSIRLAEPVHGLRVVGDGDAAQVAVEHRGGTTHARCVVVAVPPALAVTDIVFEPELPIELARLAERTPIWMGTTTKVVAEYEAPFWRRDGLAGSAISYSGPLRELHDLGGPGDQAAAIFGFAMPTSQPLMRDAIIAQLVALFGQQARTPLALHVKDWRTERWTSPAHVEQLSAYDTYSDSRYRNAIHERIWLASTETGPDHAGHIEGALAAAEVVGRAVCGLLGARQ